MQCLNSPTGPVSYREVEEFIDTVKKEIKFYWQENTAVGNLCRDAILQNRPEIVQLFLDK